MSVTSIARRLCPPVLWSVIRPTLTPRTPAHITLGAEAILLARVQGAGHLTIGEASVVHGLIDLLTPQADVRVGRNTLINSESLLSCIGRITIGDDVLISYKCAFMDSDGHSLKLSERRDDLRKGRAGTHSFAGLPFKPVSIGCGVWIGAHCLILKGVTVGDGAIVAAGSVVTRDVPDWSIVAGNPARVVRHIAVGDR
jgi:galactoside O-acetyltransferase